MSDNPESAFHAYLQAFETLDPEAPLPYYHLPSMFIAPQGVFVAQTPRRLERCSPNSWANCGANPIAVRNLRGLRFAGSRRTLHLVAARLCASTPAVSRSRGLASPTPCVMRGRGKLLLRLCMLRLRPDQRPEATEVPTAIAGQIRS